MRENKVIHFYIRGNSKSFPEKFSKYYFMHGWSQQVANNVLKMSNKFTMENWRYENEVNKIETKTINKIKCRLFPARRWPILQLFSFNLIKELKKEIRENNIIIHIYQMHDFRVFILLFLFRKVPIIVSNNGNRPAKFFYKDTKNPKYLIKDLFFRKVVKHIDYYFPTGSDDRMYMSTLIDEKKMYNTMSIGVDFEKIIPTSKEVAKKLLNIKPSQKVMVYVGKLYDIKGVDIIINSFLDLKKDFDVKLFLIGGSSTDMFYNMAINSGAVVLPYMNRDVELPIYLSAADVFVVASFNDEKIMKFSGLGIAPIEAMACGTPVVSPSLRHFPAKDVNNVGVIPKSKQDVTNCIKYTFNNEDQFITCRSTARKHYDWSIIAKEVYNQYSIINRKLI